MHCKARNRAHQVVRRRIYRHPRGGETPEALQALLQQQQRAHAIAERQRALDDELALGDEDAVAGAVRAVGTQAQRRRAQVRVLAYARIEGVVEQHPDLR